MLGNRVCNTLNAKGEGSFQKISVVVFAAVQLGEAGRKLPLDNPAHWPPHGKAELKEATTTLQVLGDEPVLLLLLQTSLLFPAGKKAVSDSREGVKETNRGVKIHGSACGLFASEN